MTSSMPRVEMISSWEGAGATQMYGSSDRGLVVDLPSGQATGWGTDELRSIEVVFGSDLADTILGDERANLLVGGGGRDLIRGRGANDRLFGSTGGDDLYGGQGYDRLNGGPGIDSCNGADQTMRCE